jgi:putative mRNA 3-end processing factor
VSGSKHQKFLQEKFFAFCHFFHLRIFALSIIHFAENLFTETIRSYHCIFFERKMDLLKFTELGIYCEQGNFYIDPWRPVDFAIITHAHSDHARFGCKHYMAHRDSAPVLRLRLGNDISLQTVDYEENIFIRGVKVSLHPAGHIIGSSQVRVEYHGQVWVAAGDYKLQNDTISEPFQPVKCHTFITESTFGLPVYQWKSSSTLFEEINQWWKQNREKGKVSVLCGYALGKAQRLTKFCEPTIGKIYLHGAVGNLNNALIANGICLPAYPKAGNEFSKKDYEGALIIAPPSVIGSAWLNKFEPYAIGMCSGWMQIRGNKRRQNADVGFALSDHADWKGLLAAIKATEAERVIVTHGYTDVLSRYLNEIGIAAQVAKTEFNVDDEE